MTKLSNPEPIFLDASGGLADGGYIFLGVANDDPETNPIDCFWDFARTIPAEQPIRTIGGLVVNGTTPASVFFAESDYSTRMKDSGGNLVFYAPTTYPVGSFQPLDSDLTAIAALGTTAYGRALLTLANQAALQTALGLPAALPLTGGALSGPVTRSGGGGYFYGTDPAMTDPKIYPPLAIGTANPATGAGSLQGFY